VIFNIKYASRASRSKMERKSRSRQSLGGDWQKQK